MTLCGTSHPMQADERFCRQCGAPRLADVCSNGHAMAEGDVFCRRCGERRPFDSSVPALDVTEPVTDPSSAHIADSALGEASVRSDPLNTPEQMQLGNGESPTGAPTLSRATDKHATGRSNNESGARRGRVAAIGAVVILVIGIGVAASIVLLSRSKSPPSARSSIPTRSASPTKTTSTRVLEYAPWTQAGALAPGIQVTGHLTDGSCSIGSLADGADQDAWRCFSGNGIYDPCFPPPGNPLNVTQLACALTPLSGVEMMTLAAPLPSSSSGTTVNTGPWFMQLTNGERCVHTGGAASSSDGVYFIYDCRNAMGKVSSGASTPNTATEPWTVKYLPNGSHVISEVDVTTAWS
jgi:hypothetical protein